MRRKVWLGLLSLFSLLSLGGTARAQSPSADFADRTLSGHTFMYPLLQEGAFNTTHVGIRQGVAYLVVPRLPLGSAGTFDLAASGLVQNIDFGVRLFPIVGLYGTASGQVVTGTNVDSLILFGGSLVVNGEGGAIVRIARLERSGTEISARAFGGGGTGRDVKVLPLVSALLAGGASLNDVVNGGVGRYVLVPRSNNTFGASMHAAQALGRFVGLQAAVDGRSTRDTTSPYEQPANAPVAHTTSTLSFRGSIGAGVDGAPAGFPVGALAEYQLDYDRASPDQGDATGAVSHLVAVSLYYTGRRDLVLGVGAATQLNLQPITGQDAAGNPGSSGPPSVYFGQFIFRYIF